MSFAWILARFLAQIVFHSQMREKLKWVDVLRGWVGHWLDHQTQRVVVSSSYFSYWWQVTCGVHTELIEALLLFNISTDNQNDYIESTVSKVWGNTRLGRAGDTLDCSLLFRGISIGRKNGLRGTSENSMKSYKSSLWQNKAWNSPSQAESG